MNFKSNIRRKVKHGIKLLSAGYRKQYELDKETNRLKSLPRYQQTETTMDGRTIKIPDAASYLFIYDEIFQKEIYRFKSETPKPLILDCGANIGLSLIYFKHLFPDATIIAFEPDPLIFEILSNNISAFQLQEVRLLNNALWEEEGEFDFYAEGADGGRLLKDDDTADGRIKIKALQLSKFLDRPVDLLKIDIEGAEYEVLKQCESVLYNVGRIFVEYHSAVNKEQRLDEILALLKNAGFRYYIQHIGISSDHPFVFINTYLGMDLQLNIFAYR